MKRMFQLLIIGFVLLFLNCTSTSYLLDDPNDAIKLGYEITKIDTIGYGLYEVYIK